MTFPEISSTLPAGPLGSKSWNLPSTNKARRSEGALRGLPERSVTKRLSKTHFCAFWAYKSQPVLTILVTFFDVLWLRLTGEWSGQPNP